MALAVLYDFGANRGDEIILPALSFVSTANVALQTGFNPVFVDVKRETLNIDPAEIENVITKNTKAIMHVHLMGKPAETDIINKLAKKYGLYIIGDAVEAHWAIYKGRNAGALADVSAYSFYVAHIITTIEGDIVVTDNSDFAETLRSLRSNGRACKCKSCLLNTKSAYYAVFLEKKGIDTRDLFSSIPNVARWF
jgi:dTDP-4-amino-4,6-dideoxygalactose transaminase